LSPGWASAGSVRIEGNDLAVLAEFLMQHHADVVARN
jgi:hypothetical protein